METRNFLAFDLGAESGRALVGAFDGARLSLNEVHRFANRPLRVGGHLHWNVLQLFDDIQLGLNRAGQQYGEIASLGIDTWGVDFALLDESGMLLGNPFHYRDPRTDGMLEEAFRRVPREKIFQTTGIQFMQLNTLYQLLAMSLSQPRTLMVADKLLMMPDLFNYWLTGEQVSEFTIATTTQFYDPRAGDWARTMLDELQIPHHFMPPVIPPATVLGPLAPHVLRQSGLQRTRVIAPACHDTASAIAAVPAQVSDYAYISSGTWSLMGIQVREPIIDDETLRYNFTNEGGAGGRFQLLKNITGLWLIQECRRVWAARGTELSYAELMSMAAQAEPFAAFIDPDDSLFLHPEDMPGAIASYCEQTSQNPPRDQASTIRCALESLALKYRHTRDQLERILGKRIGILHVLGGGSQNHLLNQFTADACARPVLAGPVEATALGNILLQMVAQEQFNSLEEARQVGRVSFPLRSYEPQNTAAWDEAYGRFIQLTQLEQT